MPVTARLKSLTGKRARVQTDLLRQKVEDLGDKILLEAEDVLTTYPPPKAGSRYNRTDRLKEGWHFKFSSVPSGVNLRITNTVPYVVKVHGNEGGVAQWPMHATTGWILFAIVLQKARLKWNTQLKAIYKQHPIVKWE